MADLAQRAGVSVRELRPEDWPTVVAIYAAGIASGNATFETEAPRWTDFDRKKLPTLRFVAARDDEVIGWAAAEAVSERCVYAGVIEHSVYVDPVNHGQGVGRQLLESLIAASEQQGIWTIRSGIFPENSASLAVHRACGFRVVGRWERVGCHRGRWRDVVIVERRSALVGT